MKDQKPEQNKSDVTKEDIQNLGRSREDLRRDGGSDEQLKDRERPVDFAGKELDIPGRTLPDDRDPSDPKDEENQLYSQGDNGK